MGKNIWLVGLTLIGLLIVPAQVGAVEGQVGLTVTPAIVRLDLSESAPETSLTYTNTTGAPVELVLTAQDFSELEDGWKVKFLEAKDAATYPYSLASWIKFETATLFLNPGETQVVSVFIDTSRLTAGGHYASIVATIKQQTDSGHIGLQGGLATLLFVRTVQSAEREEGKISTFTAVTDDTLPLRYNFRFQNSGNVELVPYGQLEVYDWLGRVVAKGILNENSLITLPETIRRYDVVAAQWQRWLWPGRYRAHVMVHFGRHDVQVNQDLTFFSWGSVRPVWVGGLLVVIGLLWFFRQRWLGWVRRGI